MQSCNIVLLNSFCFSFRGSVQFVGKDYVQDSYKRQQSYKNILDAKRKQCIISGMKTQSRPNINIF